MKNLIITKNLILILLALTFSLPAYDIPQNLIDKINSETPADAVDSVWKNIVNEYGPRINTLDSSDALVKKYLDRIQYKLYVAFFSYNNNDRYNHTLYHHRASFRLKANLEFFVSLLENQLDPEDYMPGISLGGAFVNSSGITQYYEVAVPKDYNPAEASPVVKLNQVGPNIETVTLFPYLLVYNGSDNIKELFLEVGKDFHIDPFRTFAMSHSQGGQVTFENAISYPHRYAALSTAANSTRTPVRDETFSRVKYLVNIPIRLVCGENDWFYHDNFEVMQELTLNGGDVEFLFVPGDHGMKEYFDSTQYSLMIDGLDGEVLYPYPTTVVKNVTTSSSFSVQSMAYYTRAYWVNALLNKDYASTVKNLDEIYYRISAVKDSNFIRIEHADHRFSGFEFFLNDSLVNTADTVTVINDAGDIIYKGAVPGDGKLTIHLYDASSIPRTLPPVDREASYITKAPVKLMWEELLDLEENYFGVRQAIPSSDNMVKPSYIERLQSTAGIEAITVSPNPFNPLTSIQIPRTFKGGELLIYNIKGRQVRRISNLKFTSFHWNASALSGGTYFIKVSKGIKTLQKKAMLLK
jgi:hypothetical protein